MRKLLSILTVIFCIGCNAYEEELPMGKVSFKNLEIGSFENNSPNTRVASASEWNHIFVDHAQLVLTNNQTGEEYILDYDPGDFSQSYQIQIPYGEYTFSSIVEGNDMEDYLPFVITGAFLLTEAGQEIILEGHTDYSLVTFSNEFIETVTLQLGEESKELPRTGDRRYFYQYVRANSDITIEIEESFDRTILSENLSTGERVHYHYALSLPESGNLNVVSLILQEFEYDEERIGMNRGHSNIVRDYEGNTYKVVKIGNQIWMGENLRSKVFCNGDELRMKGPRPLPQEGVIRPFRDHSQPAYFHVDFNAAYDATFGLLYNQQVVQDDRNICPCDWELPSTEDWLELRDYLGGAEQASLRMRSPDPNFWIFPNFFDPSDVSDFNALGAGIFADTFDPFYQDGFYHTLESASWWTTERDTSIMIGVFGFGDSRSNSNFWIAGVSDGDEHFYRSIRCIKKN